MEHRHWFYLKSYSDWSLLCPGYELLLLIACTISMAGKGPPQLSLPFFSSKELCFSLASLWFAGKTDVTPGRARINAERKELQGCTPQHTWPKLSPGMPSWGALAQSGQSGPSLGMVVHSSSGCKQATSTRVHSTLQLYGDICNFIHHSV